MISIIELKKNPEMGSKLLLKEFLNKDVSRSEEFQEGARSFFIMILDDWQKPKVTLTTNKTNRDAFMYGFFEAIKFYGNVNFEKNCLKSVE